LPDTENKPSCRNCLYIDEESFEKAYNLYWEKVYAVCYNNIKETEPAREMVQDIFKSLWERRDQLELENIKHYLIRAAKFKTFEYIRNKACRQKHICLNLQGKQQFTNCTEEHILFNSLKEKINLLIDTLPCQCKRVYKMSRDQGLANKEIAMNLLITERAVEYHISKATSMLKIKLSEYSYSS